ncbi:MAG: hypothetical protein K2I22_01675 [Lachnospiraceae bacterium]|nr:hypothetical protein [Lachnospiraceae bacterium]
MKNLEDEYKRFNQEETPDLWNRIEAGLTDKKAKPKKNIRTFKYASVCAAAVLLVILLPSLYFIGLHGRNYAADTAPENNMMPDAAGGAMNGAAADNSEFLSEADCSTQDGGQRNEEAADSVGQYEQETGERSEASASIVQDASSDTADKEQSGSDTASGGVAPAEEDKDGVSGTPEDPVSATEPPTNGGVEPEKAEAPLSGKMEVTDAEQKDGRTVYYLRTEDGRTVSAVFGEETGTELQTGETYLFTLKASGEEAWEYIIVAAE